MAAARVADCKVRAPEPKLLSGHEEFEHVTPYSYSVDGPKHPKMYGKVVVDR